MRALLNLCSKQEEVARTVQTRDAWSVVLFHHLEMLRLCAPDNMDMRLPTPFLLLRLNRDDDAYCFCRHWFAMVFVDTQHPDSRESDWIYGREENCRLKDVFQDVGEQRLNFFCAS